MTLKDRQVSAFFRFSTKCSISTLNKRASFTRIHEYFLKSPPKGKHQRWETPAAETHLSVLCMKAPLTGNMFSQCNLYKNMKRGLRWGPAGLPQRLWGNRFMSLGSVDHQTGRRCFLWRPSVSLVCRWTDVRDSYRRRWRSRCSSHQLSTCSSVFSALFSSLSSRFIKYDVFWHSGHFLLYLLHLFIFVDIFFLTDFHWKYFCMFVFWNVISSYLCFSSFADWCINYTLNKFF